MHFLADLTLDTHSSLEMFYTYKAGKIAGVLLHVFGLCLFKQVLSSNYLCSGHLFSTAQRQVLIYQDLINLIDYNRYNIASTHFNLVLLEWEHVFTQLRHFWVSLPLNQYDLRRLRWVSIHGHQSQHIEYVYVLMYNLSLWYCIFKWHYLCVKMSFTAGRGSTPVLKRQPNSLPT